MLLFAQHNKPPDEAMPKSLKKIKEIISTLEQTTLTLTAGSERMHQLLEDIIEFTQDSAATPSEIIDLFEYMTKHVAVIVQAIQQNKESSDFFAGTLVKIAIMSRQLPLFKQLASVYYKTEVNRRFVDRRTMLMALMQELRVKTIDNKAVLVAMLSELLKNEKLNVNLPNKIGETALIIAAQSPNTEDILQLLLKHSSMAINTKTPELDTALGASLRFGDERRFLALLCSDDIDVNVLKTYEWSDLIHKKQHGMLAVLLSHPGLHVSDDAMKNYLISCPPQSNALKRFQTYHESRLKITNTVDSIMTPLTKFVGRKTFNLLENFKQRKINKIIKPLHQALSTLYWLKEIIAHNPFEVDQEQFAHIKKAILEPQYEVCRKRVIELTQQPSPDSAPFSLQAIVKTALEPIVTEPQQTLTLLL